MLFRSPVDIARLVEEVTGLFDLKAQEKGLTLARRVHFDDPFLCCNRSRVRQILVNLVGNAVKFTEAGEVTLEAHAIETPGDQAPTLVFRVSDTGIGIPDDRLADIFDRFAQVDMAHARSYEGTGLGLAITKELTKRMGGTIGVESAVDHGSTFTVTLPCPEPEDDPAILATAMK